MTPDARQDDATSGRTRVLVVDDNIDGAEMMAEALDILGYSAAVAHDGPDALRIEREFSPQVALLDIGLPTMDGYELARRLRDVSPAIKLVAITGYGRESDRQRSREAGFAAHVEKPVDLDKLSALLVELAKS